MGGKRYAALCPSARYIVICILLAFVVSLGTAQLTRLILPMLYEGYVEKNTIAENEIGGPAGEDVFRAQSVADLLNHDTFTVVSPGIKYYNNGTAMYNGKMIEELMLPSGEFVAAVINRQNISSFPQEKGGGEKRMGLMVQGPALAWECVI